MHIRRAEPGDAPTLAALHIACWQETYAGILGASYLASLSEPEHAARRAAAWVEILSDGTQSVLIGTIGSAQVGFAHTAPCRDIESAPYVGELVSLYLRRALWGGGHGRALNDVAHEALKRDGYRRASLWVLEANQRARRFYEKAGYRPDGATKTAQLGGTAYAKLRMARDLD